MATTIKKMSILGVCLSWWSVVGVVCVLFLGGVVCVLFLGERGVCVRVFLGVLFFFGRRCVLLGGVVCVCFSRCVCGVCCSWERLACECVVGRRGVCVLFLVGVVCVSF